MAGRLSIPKDDGEGSKAVDVRWPYRLAVMLLYGRLKGIIDADSGNRVIHYAELRKVAGRLPVREIKKHLHALKRLGIISYLQAHSHFAVLKLAPPLGFIPAPPNTETPDPIVWAEN